MITKHTLDENDITEILAQHFCVTKDKVNLYTQKESRGFYVDEHDEIVVYADITVKECGSYDDRLHG